MPDDAFRAARSGASKVLGKVMPFWYFATLLVLVAATVLAGAVPVSSRVAGTACTGCG